LLSFAAADFRMQNFPQFPPERQTFPEAFFGVEFVHHPLNELLAGRQIASPHKWRSLFSQGRIRLGWRYGAIHVFLNLLINSLYQSKTTEKKCTAQPITASNSAFGYIQTDSSGRPRLAQLIILLFWL